VLEEQKLTSLHFLTELSEGLADLSRLDLQLERFTPHCLSCSPKRNSNHCLVKSLVSIKAEFSRGSTLAWKSLLCDA